MPKTWLPEALKAQAVAARSYALAVRKTTGAFDVYPDTRSQVYGGVNAESPTTTAAVDATVGGVLTYGGKIATTYFFSTSGGRTAAINDVWKSAPVPYLVSVQRSVRLALAVPRLGAARVHAGEAQERCSRCPGGCSTCRRR